MLRGVLWLLDGGVVGVLRLDLGGRANLRQAARDSHQGPSAVVVVLMA